MLSIFDNGFYYGITSRMKDFVPFLQTLVWPVFLGVLVYKFRNQFTNVMQAIESRIRDGSGMEVGAQGFILSSAPRLSDEVNPEEIDDGEVVSVPRDSNNLNLKNNWEKSGDAPSSLNLVHRTEFSRVKNKRNYYRIFVSIDGRPEELSKVKKVIYFLHDTFKNPIREIDSANSNFLLRTAAWGEFTIRADVYLDDQKDPIHLSRYLDIQRT